ncbi:hypothetical protein COCMIDRAFT_29138 [Bipolaris oryzae ATCC 44560]|uniref:Amine oxidase n=1 Tax=Bipolaris oryzae ATCC 44560 TaxID=930090 RepID=W6YXF9_COCMI|nr:uncharacterized protein COCMIDRAFT_29138 [Bipolaris oryzae ATCC 44560]EUC42223.1 hypothetical protein COCMIDRAFT_29138 [Bipolaris oryzae ATCC 44560]
MWTSTIILGAAALVSSTAAQQACTPPRQPTLNAPVTNPWRSLSKEETASANDILQQKLKLNGNQGYSQDSYVVQLALLEPNKTETAKYLDGYGKPPGRYARATVQSGATNTTDMFWQEYMVGPLPATYATTITPLTFPFQNTHAGKTKVHPLYSSTNEGTQFLMKFGAAHEDISQRLFNTTFLSGLVGLRFGAPFKDEDGRIISWAATYGVPTKELSSVTVAPLGFNIKFDISSRDWNDWSVAGWYSVGKFYASTEEFRAAINSPKYKKPSPNVAGEWSSTDKNGSPMPLDEQPPPTSIAQGAQRFRIDPDENYISWMDFSFYHNVAHDRGLSLFDIKYKGKRILYELSLQEALTAYSGSDPFASQATFYDTTSGMGAELTPLIKGYDCPSYATYLPASWNAGNATKTLEDAICIFEFDPGYPIRRHSFGQYTPHTSVAKNIQFTMRTVATVGNYDFLIDYTFFYDGAIEVSSRFSGYISSTYWENTPDYGFHIHDYLSGSMHDHTLTFKADFDINGRKNSVQKVTFKPITTDYPWSTGRKYNTFNVQRSFIDNESHSKINWAENDNTMYAVVNKDTPNRFGEYTGYRIKRAAGAIHLTQTNSTNTGKAGAFVTHDLYITKQKDTEPRAADSLNQYQKEDPLVDFSTFFDGESLDQEDVILWFNLGMHHIPGTNDLPVTMFSSAHSAMRLEPLNYLEDGDPSVSSNQQVRIDYDDAGKVKFVEEFGKVGGKMCR